MNEAENLTRLIGGIYDAALEPVLWSDVLAKVAAFVGGNAAALFSKNAAVNHGNIYHAAGTDPYFRKVYFDKYVKLDPLSTGHFFADVEQPISTSDLMPYDQFLETQFYREWVKPQGLVDFVSAVLEKSVTSVAMFGVFRHERDGLVDNETRRRMRLVVPHIRRAVLIGGLFDLRQAEAASFADILDGLSAGMILVNDGGHIVHTNSAARALLESGDFVRAVDGRLVTSDAQVDQTLREIFAIAGHGDGEMGSKGIALPLTGKEGGHSAIHVLPLTSGARRRAGAAYTATAAVFVCKASLEAPSAPEVIAKAYKLTPSELRVLLAIVEVGGVPEVAVALGVAESTIKTHVARVFEKTGAGRQADLVKLVAGYSSPLVA